MGDYLSRFVPEQPRPVEALSDSQRRLVEVILEYACHCVVREHLSSDHNATLNTLSLFGALGSHVDKLSIDALPSFKDLLNLARAVVLCRLSFHYGMGSEDRTQCLFALVRTLEELQGSLKEHKKKLSSLILHAKIFAFVLVLGDDGETKALETAQLLQISQEETITDILKALDGSSVDMGKLAAQHNLPDFLKEFNATIRSIYTTEFSTSTVEQVCSMMSMDMIGKLLSMDPFLMNSGLIPTASSQPATGSTKSLATSATDAVGHPPAGRPPSAAEQSTAAPPPRSGTGGGALSGGEEKTRVQTGTEAAASGVGSSKVEEEDWRVDASPPPNKTPQVSGLPGPQSSTQRYNWLNLTVTPLIPVSTFYPPASKAGQNLPNSTPSSSCVLRRKTPRRCVRSDFNRRRRVKWSEWELSNLKKGVVECGPGKWSEILRYCKFGPNRTNVSLKDKWRNLSKAEQNKVLLARVAS